jgi:predicted aldo/keto reductase-like oxidoreductase
MSDRSKSPDMERRKFLKSGLAAAGGAVLGLGVVRAGSAQPAVVPEKRIRVGDTIPTRRFGSTGHTLPVLGMGGSAMVGVWARSYGVTLGDLEQRAEMVRTAYDRGVRFFDTARVYGESERIMGMGLAEVRENVYLATKVANPDPAQTRRSVETSLRELRTDYVDCVQIHSPAIERVGFDGAMRIHEELDKLRAEGLIRFIGLTTHVAFEDVLRMISTGGFDQVLLAYGYFRKGMDQMLSDRKIEYRNMCLARAHEQGMAIVAMKVLGANIMSHNARNVVPGYEAAKLKRIPPAAIRWVLQDQRVSMLNIGVSVPGDLEANITTLTGDTGLTSDDQLLLADFSASAYESGLVKAMRRA